MSLTERRNNLRHLEAELSICVGQSGTVALRVTFVPFGGVRPDLYALVSKRRSIACTPNCASHPEATTTDAIHYGCAHAVIVGSAPH